MLRCRGSRARQILIFDEGRRSGLTSKCFETSESSQVDHYSLYENEYYSLYKSLLYHDLRQPFFSKTHQHLKQELPYKYMSNCWNHLRVYGVPISNSRIVQVLCLGTIRQGRRVLVDHYSQRPR